MQGIEVLLIQGSWPAKSSLLWKIPSLKMVLRVGPDKDRRAKQRAPAGWSVKCTRLKHDQLGGVTTGEFRSYVAIPPGEELLAMQTSQGLNNTLGQIISPMEKCFTWVNEPDQGAVNTGKGLLKWTERFAPVVTPSVFKPNAWGLRKLTVHELASALDFPSTRTDAMTDPEVLRKLTKSEMPGKIWVAGLEYLRTWNRHSATTRKVCGFQSDSGFSTSGFGVPISDFSSGALRMNRGSKRIRGDDPEFQSAKRNCARDISYVSSEDEMVEEVEERAEQLNSKSWALHHDMKEEDEEAKFSTVTEKAVKSDDAAVPEHLWNDRVAVGLRDMRKKQDRIFPFDFESAKDCKRFSKGLAGFRAFALKIWKRKVRREFLQWFEAHGQHHAKCKDILRDGLRACSKADQCSWWNWDAGSAIFFWRWPSHYRETARLGVTPYFDTPPPC